MEKGDRLMRYWLFKSEPDTWGWDDQVAKGDVGEEWDGVRNYQARNNMRAMELGDLGFFYHSNIGKEVVGIVEVCALAHPDSTTDDPRWECVDIKAVRPLAKPVTLDMWIDPETGYVREAELATVFEGQISDWDIEFTEFGVPVEIAPPDLEG